MTKPRVVIVGAGFAGCAVTVAATKAGAEVVLLERMDFVNAVLVESAVRQVLDDLGVDLRLENRVVDVVKKGAAIKAVLLDGGEGVEGDAFVDCSGNSGE